MSGTHETVYAVRALPAVRLGIVGHMDYDDAWIFSHAEEQYAVRLECQSTYLPSSLQQPFVICPLLRDVKRKKYPLLKDKTFRLTVGTANDEHAIELLR